MRQVARRRRVQRSQQQERARLPRRDQLKRQLARQMKAGIEIDRMHPLPGFGVDGQRMIGLAPRRRGAVDEMGHLPERGLRVRQQRIAGVASGEIADPRHRQLRPRRRLDRGRHPLRADVGKHRAHALADQRLGDGAADAVPGTGHQRGLARGVEWIFQQAHIVISFK